MSEKKQIQAESDVKFPTSPWPFIRAGALLFVLLAALCMFAYSAQKVGTLGGIVMLLLPAAICVYIYASRGQGNVMQIGLFAVAIGAAVFIYVVMGDSGGDEEAGSPAAIPNAAESGGRTPDPGFKLPNLD